MTWKLPPALLGALALLAVAAPLRAAAPAEGRTWRHPKAWYPGSVARWFASLPPALQYSEVRFRAGDDASWARPDWDDREWTVKGFWDLPARAGIHWVRFRVRMGADGRERLPAGVMMSTVIAYDVFWDGVLLGSNGVPANDPAGEHPGRVDNWFSIPAPLLGPGEHVVAVRISSYRCGFPAATSGFRFLLDAPAVLQNKVVREAVVPTVAAGALCMVGLAALILWLLAARQSTLLLFGGMCLGGALMQGLHAVRWFYPYAADRHFPALVAMTWLVGAQGLCLVALVVVHFELPRRRWVLGALIVIFGLVGWLSPERKNLEGVNILFVAFVASLLCAAWAAARRRRGAWLAVAGLIPSAGLVAYEAEDYRTNFFLKFLPAMLGLMAALAVRLHDERRRAQAAQHAAARLELELLKKNIQPHFLLNTLATILETIEQEPRTAAALVEALAGEFRVLSRVAGEPLIPLAQELELCRAHLRVMSLRQGVACSLQTAIPDAPPAVPPALFHTLIENGLTHLRPRDGRLEFHLRAEDLSGGTRFVLRADGFRPDRPGPAAGGPAPADGTGLRYVKARLEESYPGRWSLRGGPISAGWETTIELAVRSGGAAARGAARPPAAIPGSSA